MSNKTSEQEVSEISMKSLFSGFPFLNHEFNHNEFLAAVLASRLHYSKGTEWEGCPQDYYFRPEVAEDILLSYCNNDDIQATLKFIAGFASEPDKKNKGEIEDSINLIVQTQPKWDALFHSIPLSYYISNRNDGVISFSTYIRPQSIFLSKDIAFQSCVQLSEQILHEVTHNWLYLMEELWRYHEKHEHDSIFELPSGAKNKTATEVISAAYVVTVLATYYRSLNESEWNSRIQYLDKYKYKCLIQLEDYGRLTSLGRETVRILGK